MARHYFNTVENSVTGKPVNGATIEVLSSAGAYVTIYSDDGTTAIDQSTSPLTSDSTGFFEFWTNETSGTVRISYDGTVKRTITDVEFPDGAVTGDVSALEARVDTLEAADIDIIERIEGLEFNTGGNQLLEGGAVIWETGLQYRVSAASYRIAGVVYTSAEQTVTLTAADGSNPRIDVLILNTSGLADKVTGTAAASPSEPDIDPSTQLKLIFVLVGAAVSSPAGVTTENIYLENTEWTGTSSGTTWALGSTSNPYAGTTCIEATTLTAGAYISYDKGTAQVWDSYDVLGFFIRSKAAWASGRTLRIQMFNNGVAVGTGVTLASGYWGFNSSTTGSYQFVGIPLPNFVIPTGQVWDQIRVTAVGAGVGFYLDKIVLQDYGSTQDNSGGAAGVTQDQADARYLQRANNLSDLASAATARTNLGADVYLVSLFATTAPTSSEVLCLHIVTDAFTFPADFASPASKGVVGTNPAATFAIDVQRQVNATGAFATIGTISISTGGAFTFTTASGTAKSIAVNDVLKFVAPASADASIANLAVTLRGSRT